jgi:hypothetical protein
MKGPSAAQRRVLEPLAAGGQIHVYPNLNCVLRPGSKAVWPQSFRMLAEQGWIQRTGSGVVEVWTLTEAGRAALLHQRWQ